MRLRREIAKEESDKRELGREFIEKITSVQEELDTNKMQITEATATWSRHLNAAVLEIRRLNGVIAQERGTSIKNFIHQLQYSTSDHAFLLKIVAELNAKLQAW